MKKNKPNELKALAKFLDCNSKELSKQDSDYYGLNTYSIGKQEYAIGTEEEVNMACNDNICDSVWAFTPSFIISHSFLGRQAEEFLGEYQKTKCESANDSILGIIKDFGKFVDDAIRIDGRGHFLSGYDGQENEQDKYFIYRIN